MSVSIIDAEIERLANEIKPGNFIRSPDREGAPRPEDKVYGLANERIKRLITLMCEVHVRMRPIRDESEQLISMDKMFLRIGELVAAETGDAIPGDIPEGAYAFVRNDWHIVIRPIPQGGFPD